MSGDAAYYYKEVVRMQILLDKSRQRVVTLEVENEQLQRIIKESNIVTDLEKELVARLIDEVAHELDRIHVKLYGDPPSGFKYSDVATAGRTLTMLAKTVRGEE